MEPLQLAGGVTPEWCHQLQHALHKASWAGVAATQQVLPPPLLCHIVTAAAALLDKEPTLLEVRSDLRPTCSSQRRPVVVLPADVHACCAVPAVCVAAAAAG